VYEAKSFDCDTNDAVQANLIRELKEKIVNQEHIIQNDRKINDNFRKEIENENKIEQNYKEKIEILENRIVKLRAGNFLVGIGFIGAAGALIYQGIVK
jgi:hypothetical protein